MIFHFDGTLDDDPRDRGSYNFGLDKLGPNHSLNDVVPWVAWGNSSSAYGNKGDDTTTVKQRHDTYNMLGYPNWRQESYKKGLDGLKNAGLFKW